MKLAMHTKYWHDNRGKLSETFALFFMASKNDGNMASKNDGNKKHLCNILYH